ncbi:MAG TPA: FAD-binding oxidoreductase [Aestuariivirga sp.]|nr:FAD-binding oxidoreductase [Aestuariivirga sp.]
MLQTSPAAETWYEATAQRGSARPQLSTDIQAEICVIGGGLAGLTTALELARRGKRVALLEANSLAWGASGRNGGFVSNGFAQSLSEIEARAGLETAKALFNLSCLGTEFVRKEIAEGLPAIKTGEGWLVARRYEDSAGLMAYRDRLERVYGDKRQFLTTDETRERLNSPRYFQSLYDSSAFHIHPLRYALLIARNAETAGAILHEHSAALEVSGVPGNWLVRTAGGSVRADHVVHTVSSLDRRIHPMTGRAVVPVATYVAVTDFIQQDSIRTESAISDSRRAGNYFRLVGEGRILWGGAITTKIAEPKLLASRMQNDLASVFPALKYARMEYAWAGLMGYARHAMPIIGGDGQGRWWATGFGGHGMNTTAMAGILLARAIVEGEDEYLRFKSFSPQWAGGPFGRAAVQASYWWMQVRDRVDEIKSVRRRTPH